MIGNSYLLDTNIISAWLKREEAVVDKINASHLIFIPVISVGEMCYGAQFSTKISQNINNISLVVSNYTVLGITKEVCNYYGIIKASLRRKGKPIPENDIWIAAIALERNLKLVTRDQHFNEIDNLTVVNW